MSFLSSAEAIKTQKPCDTRRQVADRFLNRPLHVFLLPQDFTIKLLQKGAREYQQGHGRKKLEIWP